MLSRLYLSVILILAAGIWREPTSQEVIAPITAYLVARQTFSTLSLRMLTSESSSELVTAEISKARDGTYRLVGVYRNEPKLSVRDRSPIHYGALVLEVQRDPVTNLVGYYWTDRNSRGELTTTGHISAVHANFDCALGAFRDGAASA